MNPPAQASIAQTDCCLCFSLHFMTGAKANVTLAEDNANEKIMEK